MYDLIDLDKLAKYFGIQIDRAPEYHSDGWWILQLRITDELHRVAMEAKPFYDEEVRFQAVLHQKAVMAPDEAKGALSEQRRIHGQAEQAFLAFNNRRNVARNWGFHVLDSWYHYLDGSEAFPLVAT